MKDAVSEIKSKLDIVDVISKKVSLKKKAGRYVGLCPFHEEKTPSFSVDQRRQYYYCFGCQRGGDIFSFVQEINRVSFAEALKELADLASVRLEQKVKTKKDIAYQKQNDDSYQVLAKLTKFLQSELTTTPKALEYLEKRKINSSSIEKFSLGYMNERSHIDFSKNENISYDQLVRVGVLIKNNDNSYYSRFKDRLIFPIFDIKQRVVGFGGRSLGDEQPKYLNSPETEIFKKGQILYNLANFDRNQDNLIVAEGYLDVISLSQVGFTNSVATMGTALSQAQMLLLFRYCDTPVICFDGDSAGVRSAKRVFEESLSLVSANKYLKFAKLDKGLDPYDLIQISGKEGVNKLLKQAQSFSQFLFTEAIDIQNPSLPENRAKYSKQAKEYISQITDKELKEALFSQEYAILRQNDFSKQSYNQKNFTKQNFGRKNFVRGSRRLDSKFYNLNSLNQNILFLAVIYYPKIIDTFFDKLTNLDFEPSYNNFLNDLIKHYLTVKTLDKTTLIDYVSRSYSSNIYQKIIDQETKELAPFSLEDDEKKASVFVESYLNQDQVLKMQKEISTKQSLADNKSDKNPENITDTNSDTSSDTNSGKSSGKILGKAKDKNFIDKIRIIRNTHKTKTL